MIKQTLDVSIILNAINRPVPAVLLRMRWDQRKSAWQALTESEKIIEFDYLIRFVSINVHLPFHRSGDWRRQSSVVVESFVLEFVAVDSAFERFAQRFFVERLRISVVAAEWFVVVGFVFERLWCPSVEGCVERKLFDKNPSVEVWWALTWCERGFVVVEVSLRLGSDSEWMCWWSQWMQFLLQWHLPKVQDLYSVALPGKSMNFET